MSQLLVAFQQVYVVIVLAWCLPYTVFKYKLLGFAIMISTTLWVGVWSWYTFTGLMMAEFSTVYSQILPARGIPLNRERTRYLPAWIVPAAVMMLGWMFKYLWIAALPRLYDAEIVAHADLNTAGLNYNRHTSTRATTTGSSQRVCSSSSS